MIAVVERLVLPFGRLVHENTETAGALLSFELLSIAALLFLPSFFFGATFPLAVAVLAREGASSGAAAGSTLAWNTAGALSGSLAAGFLFIPLLGADCCMWASDYPHTDSTFPNSLAAIEESLGRLPAADRRKITATNCARLYGFESAA